RQSHTIFKRGNILLPAPRYKCMLMNHQVHTCKLSPSVYIFPFLLQFYVSRCKVVDIVTD
ncbi:hypothetical protein MKW98_028174, partial [Papaver atlanticum]